MTLPVGFHIEGTVTLILILVFRIFLAAGEDLGVWKVASCTFWMMARSVMNDFHRSIVEDNHSDGRQALGGSFPCVHFRALGGSYSSD